MPDKPQPNDPAPPPDGADDPPESEEPPANPFGLVPVLIILALIAVGFFVAFRLHEVSTLQDCVMSGRKNCAPVDTTDLK
jgi:hypothetical protein